MIKFFKLCVLLGISLLSLEFVVAEDVSTTTYYHNDILGSPIAATDENGDLKWKESYRPYGERIVNDMEAIDDTRWYTGHPQDEETGLSYMGARYYDPIIGRFMAIDPVGVISGIEQNPTMFNRYAYANNNPYKYTDPNGESPIDIIFFAVDTVRFAAAIHSGDTDAIASAGADLAASALGVLSPVPGTGQAIKAVKAAKKLKSATKTAEARAARDALSESAAKLSNSKRPATVTAGYNTKTGEVAARACGGGKCAEEHVVDALGGNKANVRFTEAVRPRTGEQVPVCTRCEGSYGRKPFPSGTTRFKSDE